MKSDINYIIQELKRIESKEQKFLTPNECDILFEAWESGLIPYFKHEFVTQGYNLCNGMPVISES